MQAALALPMTVTPPPVALPPVALPRPEFALGTSPATLSPEAGPALAAPTPLILFGRDERGRPHAACFVGHETMAVERAADLMALSFVAADTDALRDLGVNLPAGRLFASGRGFVPFVATALYDRLLAATGTPDAPRPLRAASKPAEAGGGTGGGGGGAAVAGRAERARATRRRRGRGLRSRPTGRRLGSAASCWPKRRRGRGWLLAGQGHRDEGRRQLRSGVGGVRRPAGIQPGAARAGAAAPRDCRGGGVVPCPTSTS